MNQLTWPTNIKYAARIANAREVTLQGTADLAFWQRLLDHKGLTAFNSAGRAHLMINATALVWKGLAFREYTVTVATADGEQPAQPTGYYLAQAFNSSRSLAWAERRLFHTPYAHGTIDVGVVPASMHVAEAGATMFKATMNQPSGASPSSNTAWQGHIFLPTKPAPKQTKRCFFAQLSGPQYSYPFDSASDHMEIRLSDTYAVFQWLLDSQFTPQTWHIRPNADHAKSKTYSWSD